MKSCVVVDFHIIGPQTRFLRLVFEHEGEPDGLVMPLLMQVNEASKAEEPLTIKGSYSALHFPNAADIVAVHYSEHTPTTPTHEGTEARN